MIKVYGASKLRHAMLWKTLRVEYPSIEWTARWPIYHIDVPDTEEFARRFWQEDEEDVRKSDYVLIYARPSDKLRGALVEAGMAIALEKTVVLGGGHPDYGTWQFHPSVLRCPHFHEALVWLNSRSELSQLD